MSLLPASALTSSGQRLEASGATALQSGSGAFPKNLERTGGAGWPVQPVDPQPLPTPVASAIPSAAQSAPAGVLRSILEYNGNSLTSLNARATEIGPRTAGDPLSNRLDLLNFRFQVLGKELETSAAQNNPMQLLRLQNDIYQIGEELELLSRVVDQATGGIRSLLQTQI